MARHAARLIVLVFALAFFAPRWAAAAEQTWITVDHCEPITVNGHAAQDISFGIYNKGRAWFNEVILSVDGAGLGADTCRVVEAQAPPGWFVETDGQGYGNVGGAVWYSPQGIDPRGEQGGFHVVLSEPSCCVHFAFVGPLLDDNYGSADVCFHCPFATPARPATWGSLKAIYR